MSVAREKIEMPKTNITRENFCLHGASKAGMPTNKSWQEFNSALNKFGLICFIPYRLATRRKQIYVKPENAWELSCHEFDSIALHADQI